MKGCTLSNLPPPSDEQVSEHLPWEHLTIPPQNDRRKLLIYGVAASLAVMVLAVFVFRQLSSPSASDLVPVVPIDVTAPPVDTTPIPPVVDSAEPVPPTTLLARPEVIDNISEADLMAVDPGATNAVIAATAEWMVLEFFTVDPADGWADRVEAASGLQLPDGLVPEASSPTAVSYVEWARTRSVVRTGANTYQATVLVRRMVASDGNSYQRLPIDWIEVELRADRDGSVRAVSLPERANPEHEALVPLSTGEPVWVVDSAGFGWPMAR